MAARKIGPEIFTIQASDDVAKSLITQSFFGSAVGMQLTKKLSDANPELISQKGFMNYQKFYPAGSSVR